MILPPVSPDSVDYESDNFQLFTARFEALQKPVRYQNSAETETQTAGFVKKTQVSVRAYVKTFFSRSFECTADNQL
jgi:hypothetical protein